jgi:glycosyltransferase involved in cell wall biosynthesis
MDIDFWKPIGSERQQRMMSVVNDWVNRDWCCGYQIWERTVKGLPCHVVGDTPGLSVPAESLEALRKDYSESQIFVNTSTHSPIPCSLLEAMACECAVVSTATCLIPEIIENGVNGFCTNDEDEMSEYMVLLLNDSDLCRKLGQAARQTIKEKFSMNRFISEWNNVFWNIVDA